MQGLVVPVIRNADKMNFAEIEKEINTLAKKANDGTISIDEMAGGSFTVSNGGVYGSLLSTPIINPPQVSAHKTSPHPPPEKKKKKPPFVGKNSAVLVSYNHVMQILYMI